MKTIHVKIKGCTVFDCSYNSGETCRAMAITIGGPEATCVTFASLPDKGGVEEEGEVGACRATGCMFNLKLECVARGIKVGMFNSHADCLTFKAKA